MSAKTIFLTGLLAFALLVPPGVVGTSSASPIPSYFQPENTSLLCAVVAIPNAGTSATLVQINFDPTNNGITLAEGQALFAQLVQGIGALAPLIGQNFQTTCAIDPNTIHGIGFNAFTLTQALSPSFKSFGFSTYVVFDVYLFTSPGFLGSIPTVRIDVFQVIGNNNLAYVASVEFLRDVLF